MVRMKAIARSYVWWSGVDKHIENKAKTCKQCQSVKQAPPKAPLHPWVWPTRPWEHIHIDFAGPCFNTLFMIVTDAHSKWPEIIQMKETTQFKNCESCLPLMGCPYMSSKTMSHSLPLQILQSNGIKYIKINALHIIPHLMVLLSD